MTKFKKQLVGPLAIGILSLSLLSFTSSKVQDNELMNAGNYTVNEEMVDFYTRASQDDEYLAYVERVAWPAAAVKLGVKVWQKTGKQAVHLAVNAVFSYLGGYSETDINEMVERGVLVRL